MALFMFFPIYWIFVNSLKTITGISAWPPEFSEAYLPVSVR